MCYVKEVPLWQMINETSDDGQDDDESIYVTLHDNSWAQNTFFSLVVLVILLFIIEILCEFVEIREGSLP